MTDMKSSGTDVVPMRAEHIPAMAEMEKMCFSCPWSADMLREELDNPAAVYMVAEMDGVPAGYAGMTCVCGEGYIANVAVHPAYRRRGIASTLLAKLDGIARAGGFAFLTLEVRRSNAAAIRLYGRAGFRTQGVRPGYYERPREDALIMTKYYRPNENQTETEVRF